MVLRHTIGGGTPVAFVIVAALVLLALFVGWRLALTWQRWRSRVPSPRVRCLAMSPATVPCTTMGSARSC